MSWTQSGHTLSLQQGFPRVPPTTRTPKPPIPDLQGPLLTSHLVRCYSLGLHYAFSTPQALPFFYTSKSHSSFKAFLQWHLLCAALTKSHTQSLSRASTASSKDSIRAAVPLFWGGLLVYLAVQVVSSLRPGIESLPLSILGLNTVSGTSSVHKYSSHL